MKSSHLVSYLITTSCSHVKRSVPFIVDDVCVGALPQDDRQGVLAVALDCGVHRGVPLAVRHIRGCSLGHTSPSYWRLHLIQEELDSLYVASLHGLMKRCPSL